MSKLPNHIELEFETNEGYEIKKRDDEVIQELVETVNTLIDVVANLKEQLLL